MKKCSVQPVVRLFLCVLAVLVWGLSTGGLTAAAAEKVTLQAAWIIDSGLSGVYLAIDKGYFKKAGIDLSITRGFGSSDTTKKVASGAVVFGQADTGALVVGRSQGLKAKSLLMYSNHSMYGIWALKGSGITKPKDLVGKKWGTTAGDVTRTLFPAFASVNGFDPKAVHTVLMDPASLSASLISGKVDAIASFLVRGPVLNSMASKQGKGVVSIPWHKWGISMYSLGLIARDETIASRSDFVQGFIRASQKGIKHELENPNDAIGALLKRHPERSRGLARKTLDIYHAHLVTPFMKEKGIGFIDRKKMKYTRDLITKYRNLKVTVPVDDLFTNRFLSPLKPNI